MKMAEAFYIVQPENNWYRLHSTSTHYCLGSGKSIERLLDTVERLTKECRNEQGLLNRLSETEDKGHITKKTFEVYEKDYNNLPRFDKEVRERVEKTLEDIKHNTSFNRSRRGNIFARHNSGITPLVKNKVKDSGTKDKEEIHSTRPMLKKGVFKSRHRK